METKPLSRITLPMSACFNSATDLGPWKPGDSPTVESFAYEASIRPRIWGRGNRRPRSRNGRTTRRFNSATDLGPWKPHRDNRRDGTATRASIRPRIWGRGNHTREITVGVKWLDASIRPRIWGRGNPYRCFRGRSGSRGFNSATDLGPWKPWNVRPATTGETRLQFGHGFGAVETVQSCLLTVRPNHASIRPRIWGRGNRDKESSC